MKMRRRCFLFRHGSRIPKAEDYFPSNMRSLKVLQPTWLNARLFLVVLIFPVTVLALSPPLPQAVTDCNAPVFASDFLVCGDAGLRSIDATLGELIAKRDNETQNPALDEGDADWFKQSRMCAFEPDQRSCLESTYCLRIALLDRDGSSWPDECQPATGNYRAASEVSRSGFAVNSNSIELLNGEMVALWGYVDQLNIFADETTKSILKDWWGGPAPQANTWQFGLKARPGDPHGHSFFVGIPDDQMRNDILRIFAADAASSRPTRVYLRGRLATFDAPTSVSIRTGIQMNLSSSSDLRVGPNDQ